MIPIQNKVQENDPKVTQRNIYHSQKRKIESIPYSLIRFDLHFIYCSMILSVLYLDYHNIFIFKA